MAELARAAARSTPRVREPALRRGRWTGLHSFLSPPWLYVLLALLYITAAGDMPGLAAMEHR